jgi:hypothetical protein
MTKLAEQLSALLAYRNTPDHSPEPIKSNWSTEPANDNAAMTKVERLANEKLLKVTPSIEEIARNMREDWAWHPPEPSGRNDPKTGEPLNKASTGPLKSIGRLKFSNGTQHEPVLIRGDDGKVERRLMPVRRNAMLGCTETLTDEAGGQGGAVTISNAVFCERMGVERRDFTPSGKRRPGKSFSPAQSRRMIDEAIANTLVLPSVTKCPPGVASGTAQYSEQFIGMKIGSTGKGGLIHWVDLYTAGLEHEAWVAAAGSLGEKDRAVLDAAMAAGALADIDPGGSDRGARKRGRRALIAANDNLAEYLKNFAA